MIALLLASTLAYTPHEAKALFTEANDAYYREDYPTAIDKYRRLLEAGEGGPDVLFNLGTAHLAQNELGPAVLYLTRAARQSGDDDIAAQLAVARERQLDQVVGADETVPFQQRLAHAIDDRLVGLVFLGSWWLAFLALLVTARLPAGRRLLLGLGTLGLFLVALVSGAVVGVQAWVARTVHEAVVIAPTTPAREFPGDTAKVAFEVHAGLLVRVMEDTGRFVRIRLPNALEGWVEREHVTAL